MCLLNNTKSFDLKKKKKEHQIYFWELEKIGFWFVLKKNQIFLYNPKKKKDLYIGKIKSVFLLCEKKK